MLIQTWPHTEKCFQDQINHQIQYFHHHHHHYHLRYDDVSHGLGDGMEFLSVWEPEHLRVVLEVVLDAVVDVRHLADVVETVRSQEILHQFAPTTVHQFPGLTVVQFHV